jgi:hypothetical protein
MEPFTTVELCTGRVGATPPNAIERYPRGDASGTDLDGLRRGLPTRTRNATSTLAEFAIAVSGRSHEPDLGAIPRLVERDHPREGQEARREDPEEDTPTGQGQQLPDDVGNRSRPRTWGISLDRRLASDANERDAGLVTLVTDRHFRLASLREQDQIVLEALRQTKW